MLTFDQERHLYFFNEKPVPSVTQILSPLVDFSGVPAHVLAHASARGVAVHYGCELLDNDQLDWLSVGEELKPYIDGWAEFKAKTGFKPVLNEAQVYHPGLCYAGTLDRTGFVSGELSVVDLKTCSSLFPTVGIQLAAYGEALNASQPKDAERHTGRYAFQMKGNGKWKLEPYTDKTDWPTFVAMKTLISWADKHQKRINYEPR